MKLLLFPFLMLSRTDFTVVSNSLPFFTAYWKNGTIVSLTEGYAANSIFV